jgi:alkylation response protein AidB-like acyl-CoA dehydrogenase
MLYEAGWAGLSWPRTHGGQGASAVEQAIFAEQIARAHLPRQINIVGPELAGPMIMEYGTEEQKRRYLLPILEGSEVWCQLFSEPGAGSDLANLSARAVRDNDGWRLHGQKVWSSGAQYADFGLLLARTDPQAERHRGISCFLLPMSRPGIEVRPIRQMDGESKFNEVFFEEVPVTEDDLLGPPGVGWKVAVSTLGRERLTLGAQAVALFEALDQLRTAAHTHGTAGNALFRDRWGELWSRVTQLRMTWFRLLSLIETSADPRMSVLKLMASELQRDVAALGAAAFGPVLAAGAAGEEWRNRLLAAPGATIAGGTSEVQRNVPAERVLGLPR